MVDNTDQAQANEALNQIRTMNEEAANQKAQADAAADDDSNDQTDPLQQAWDETQDDSKDRNNKMGKKAYDYLKQDNQPQDMSKLNDTETNPMSSIKSDSSALDSYSMKADTYNISQPGGNNYTSSASEAGEGAEMGEVAELAQVAAVVA